jgi:Transposase domain (DUF772)
LRAVLLRSFYTVRSEQLIWQLYDLLFRWGLAADGPVWDATVFWKNRNRPIDGDITAKFFANWGSVSNGRSIQHPAYRISAVKRKPIEELGWMTIGALLKKRHCGRAQVEWFFVLTEAP